VPGGVGRCATDAQQKIKDIDDRINDAQAQLKKLGCYAVEPSSARFDKETQDAVNAGRI
jgi:hypothetical protein